MKTILHLLKIEWLKIKDYKAFRILLALYVVSIFGINYLVYEFQSNETLKSVESFLGNPFSFPAVWKTVSYISGFLLFIPGLTVMTNMMNEYSFRTNRQNVIDGMSRSQFITVKMIVALIIALLSTLAVFLSGLLFGTIAGKSFSFGGFIYILWFFVQACAYIGVAFLAGMLFKRQGIGIGIYFLYAFILENIASGLLNKYIRPIGYFLPLKSVNKLIEIPFGNIDLSESAIPDKPILAAIGIAYIIIISVFCKIQFEKNDL